MGKCILHFDQIEVINQKSDSGHSDNDWLILYWFVGAGGIKQSHVIPLANSSGSKKINSGNSLQPLALEVSCQDSDLVTASFQIVNLGSSGPSEQVQEAGQIASKIAQALTAAYVDAAEIVVQNSGLPLADVFAEGINELQPVIVDSVQAAFEDIIIPFVDEVAGFIAGLFGSPNCNGDVLHDVAVFPPFQPDPSVTAAKVYTAASKSGCGSPSKTSVHLTQQRVLDVVPMFSSDPPPTVETAPATGESAENWLGTWAEDSYTSTPIITLIIARSMAASGTYAVSVREHVDRRFDATFEASDQVELPESVVVPIFGGNVFGTVRPWLSHPLSPGDLQAHVQKLALAHPGTGTRSISGGRGGPPSVSFSLAWSKIQTSVYSEPKGIVSRVSGGGGIGLLGGIALLGYDTVDAFVLEGKGVTVCLYRFSATGAVIGRGVRYIRDANMSFTRADVMLVRWTPLG